MKNFFVKNRINLAVLLLFLLGACSGNEQPNNVPAAASNNNETPAANAENPLSPGNLPPPAGSAASQSVSDSTQQFFARKELWDSFSAPLKEQIMKSYNAKLGGEGPGGIGYFNTLFGRVSPKKASSGSIPANSQMKFFKSNQRMFLKESISAQDVMVEYCDFLCLESPDDKLNTIYDSVIVSGHINMSKTAIFSPSDPVMMISVFRQSGEAVAQEIPIYGNDVSSTPVSPPSQAANPDAIPPEDIGAFGKTVPLLGPGAYTVVITTFENSGGDVIAHSDYRTIYRQDIPTIELLTINPPPTGNQNVSSPGHRNDPLKKATDSLAAEYNVGMAAIDLVVKVSTASNSSEALNKNVGILFQNFDSDGNLRYSSSGNEGYGTVASLVPELPNDQTVAKKASLPLFEKYNKIVITSRNQQLDDFYQSMGLTPPPAQSTEVIIENTLPHVNIKLLTPADGSVVEPDNTGNENIKISFCMTDLPSYPGRENSAAPGACIPNWNGDQPKVIFNNLEYGKSSIAPLAYDATTGIYSINAKATLGANILNVSATNLNYLPSWVEGDSQEKKTADLGELTATFLYGKVNKMIENGKLNESDNLLKRGFSLEINKNLISKDVKSLLEKYLNQDSFKKSLRTTFTKADVGHEVVCTETGVLSVDHGDTTIDFLPEGFNIGNIVVNQIEPKADGRLYVDATIQGFHGEANLRGFNAPVQIQVGGKDANFVPLSVWVKELHAKIAIRLPKENGVMKVVIEKQSSGENAVTLLGDGPMGNIAHVNSTRNPITAALEAYDAQTGLISKSFSETLETTVLCGVEAGLNHKEDGLPHWDADLMKLVSYNNQNPFRISTEFDLLNKTVGLDIAYDILRGDIQFNNRGISIKNVPLRFTPSPKILGELVTQYTSGFLGSLSMPIQTPEAAASLPQTDESKNVSLSLSEDAINQALFAATAAGMLNLDIDPNFYTKHEINFISLALPSVDGMFPNKKVDFNHNGVQDDENLPVLLRVKGDPQSPPAIHFLNKQEVSDLAGKVNDALGAGNGTLNQNLHIFRLSVSNLELAFYAVEQVSAAQGGYKTFCTNKDDSLYSDPSLESSRHLVDPIKITDNANPVAACSQALSLTYESTTGTCGNGYNPFTAPVKNGAIISALPNQPEVPVIRMKANLVIYGVLQGVYREVLAADKHRLDPQDSSKGIEKSNYSPTTFARIKVMNYAPADPLIQIKVTENHSSFAAKDLTDHLVNTVLHSALGKECEFFNEIRIPLPDSFLKDKTGMSDSLQQTLKDFGLDYISLGSTDNLIPEMPYNSGSVANESVSNPLYLDLKAHLGLCYLGESCN